MGSSEGGRRYTDCSRSERRSSTNVGRLVPRADQAVNRLLAKTVRFLH